MSRAPTMRSATSMNNAARRNMLLGENNKFSNAQSQLNEDTFERHNDEAVDHLSSRIGALKALTIDIGAEVREHNSLLSRMETDFDKTSGLLGGTMKRLNDFAATPHGRQFCYLTFFIVFVFTITYLFFTRS